MRQYSMMKRGFFYYFVAVVVTLVGYLFLPTEQNYLTVQVRARSSSCTKMELFFTDKTVPAFTEKEVVRIPLKNSERVEAYEVKVPANTALIRLDTCETQAPTSLESVTIGYKDRSRTFSIADFLHWQCNFCLITPLSYADDPTNKVAEVVIDPTGNDPQLVNNSFGAEISSLNVPKHFYLLKIHTYLFYLLIALVMLPLAWLFWKSQKKLLWIGVTGVSVGFYALLLKFYDHLKLLFPPPLIGAEKIVGFAHFHRQPLKADTVLVFGGLLFPSFLLFCIFIVQHLLKRTHAKKK